MARIVCDLEPGIATVPFNRDFSTVNFTINYAVLNTSNLAARFYQKSQRIESRFFLSPRLVETEYPKRKPDTVNWAVRFTGLMLAQLPGRF
jgi:hypothetical protein